MSDQLTDISSEAGQDIPASKPRDWKSRFRGIIMFLKASVASQVASWIDMGLAFALFAWAGLPAAWSTASGAIAGGIVNCCINYRWTFRAGNCSIANVAIKYAMVWTGSLLLNTYGTAFFNDLFANSQLLDQWGVALNLRFFVARIGVSLIVSIFWNFMLQRYFVYRNGRFDLILNHITHPKSKH